MEPPGAGVKARSSVLLTLHARLKPLTEDGAAETVLHCRLTGRESSGFFDWVVSVPVRYPFRMSATWLEWENAPPDKGAPRPLEIRALTDLDEVQVEVPAEFVARPERAGPFRAGQVARFVIEPRRGPDRGLVRSKGRVSARTTDGASSAFEFGLRAFLDGYARVAPNPVLLGVVRPGDEIRLTVWRRDGRPLQSVEVDPGELPLDLRNIVRDQPHLWTLVLRVGKTSGGHVRGTCRVRVLSAGGAEDVWDVPIKGHVLSDQRSVNQVNRG